MCYYSLSLFYSIIINKYNYSLLFALSQCQFSCIKFKIFIGFPVSQPASEYVVQFSCGHRKMQKTVYHQRLEIAHHCGLGFANCHTTLIKIQNMHWTFISQPPHEQLSSFRIAACKVLVFITNNKKFIMFSFPHPDWEYCF